MATGTVTLPELARMVLDTLALQREFFDHGRHPDTLRACKRKEAELKRVCQEVLNPPRPGLFDADTQEGE